jgi:SAM-dependent methyltransferase
MKPFRAAGIKTLLYARFAAMASLHRATRARKLIFGISKIPPNAFQYILFQRTHFLILRNSRVLSRFLVRIPRFSYNTYVGIEALLCRPYIKRRFNREMLNEYDILRGHLPERVESILDIGCGIAGIDVLLDQHYDGVADFYLLDKTKTDENIYYGHSENAAFYNSLAVTKEFLIANGISSNRIHAQEVADDNRILFETQFDLVISGMSWGYHYPVSTYLDRVYDLLKPGGILMIDIRKEVGADVLVKNKFGLIETVYDSSEHGLEKIIARKMPTNNLT